MYEHGMLSVFAIFITLEDYAGFHCLNLPIRQHLNMSMILCKKILRITFKQIADNFM